MTPRRPRALIGAPQTRFRHIITPTGHNTSAPLAPYPQKEGERRRNRANTTVLSFDLFCSRASLQALRSLSRRPPTIRGSPVPEAGARGGRAGAGPGRAAGGGSHVGAGEGQVRQEVGHQVRQGRPAVPRRPHRAVPEEGQVRRAHWGGRPGLPCRRWGPPAAHGSPPSAPCQVH